jgi:REP element-mobilizing transposase RayT
MPQSLVKVLVHTVFSTKNRQPLIHGDFEQRMFAYMSGIVENRGCKLLLGNGTADHIHLLISLGRQIEIAKLIGSIKRDSSI